MATTWSGSNTGPGQCTYCQLDPPRPRLSLHQQCRLHANLAIALEAALEFDDGRLLPIAFAFEKRQRDSEAVRDLERSESGQWRRMAQQTSNEHTLLLAE